jgi:cation diffusion facilitator CzcD-associated flavoprotein CzcO
MLRRARKALGRDFDIDTHFTPSYNPWEQRVCLAPDGDIFKVLKEGKASVVTDHIESFTEKGIALKSGEELEADIIVTATGLSLVVMGQATFAVDGEAVDFSKTWSYKGMASSGVPNLFGCFGYLNASWTLRADLISRFVCRVVNHLHATGMRQCTPRLRDTDQGMAPRNWVEGFSSGYLARTMHLFPKQGDRMPWLNPQSYHKDKAMFLKDTLEDGVLEFSSPRHVLAEVLANTAEPVTS